MKQHETQTAPPTYTPSELLFYLKDATHGPGNPCLDLRTEANQSQHQFAAYLRISPSTLQYAEQGTYSQPPLAYRPLLTTRDLVRYQDFRRFKRRKNFPLQDFPTHLTTLPDLLKHFNLSVYQFSNAICVQHGELFRFLSQPSRQKHIPSNLVQAFQHIGLDANYIASFRSKTQ